MAQNMRTDILIRFERIVTKESKRDCDTATYLVVSWCCVRASRLGWRTLRILEALWAPEVQYPTLESLLFCRISWMT